MGLGGLGFGVTLPSSFKVDSTLTGGLEKRLLEELLVGTLMLCISFNVSEHPTREHPPISHIIPI